MGEIDSLVFVVEPSWTDIFCLVVLLGRWVVVFGLDKFAVFYFAL